MEMNVKSRYSAKFKTYEINIFQVITKLLIFIITLMGII